MSTLPGGIRVGSSPSIGEVYISSPEFGTCFVNTTHSEAENLVRHIAAAVAEQCAAHLEAACAYEDWNEEGRDAAHRIRTLPPKP